MVNFWLNFAHRGLGDLHSACYKCEGQSPTRRHPIFHKVQFPHFKGGETETEDTLLHRVGSPFQNNFFSKKSNRSKKNHLTAWRGTFSKGVYQTLQLGIGYFSFLSVKGQRKHKEEEEFFKSSQDLGAGNTIAQLVKTPQWLRLQVWTGGHYAWLRSWLGHIFAVRLNLSASQHLCK